METRARGNSDGTRRVSRSDLAYDLAYDRTYSHLNLANSIAVERDEMENGMVIKYVGASQFANIYLEIKRR